MRSSYQLPLQIVNIEHLDDKIDVVFNFAVEEDESYVINGVVSHNCRCTLAPMTDDMPDETQPDYGEFDEWLKS